MTTYDDKSNFLLLENSNTPANYVSECTFGNIVHLRTKPGNLAIMSSPEVFSVETRASESLAREIIRNIDHNASRLCFT